MTNIDKQTTTNINQQTTQMTNSGDPSANYSDKYPDLTASELKDKGNAHFVAKEFAQSIELYSAAIEKDPNNAVLYANRSFAYLKTECFGYSLTDATKAIEIDKEYIKGYYRRAEALWALGKYKLAIKDFEIVIKFRPNDQDAISKFNQCRKIEQKRAFERAIAVDKVKKRVSEDVKPEMMSVDDKYDGPRLTEDNKVTDEFIKQLIEHFRTENSLPRKYAFTIVMKALEIFESEPTLIDIDIPDGKKFTVCGDIHGQFYDLLNIFKLNGLPSAENPYLFNGDVVDRGSFSVECILLMFAIKIWDPKSIYIARGNHETETMNKVFGFEGEVKSKYSDQLYQLFTEVFEHLPLVHCLNKKVLVMHGGLFSKDNVTLEDIRAIDRVRQPPEEGLMCDILWSDPMWPEGRAPSKRGVGCQFGPDVTNAFLENNQLDFIIRSHEVKDEGYEVTHFNKCITVFSAPNYCDQMGNKGAFITFVGGDKLVPEYTSFDAVPHPNKKAMCYANNMFC